MKSNELRAMVVSQLNNLKTSYGVKEISFQNAQNDELFPHITFDFDSIRPLSDDLNRRDVRLIVDLWDRGNSAVLINNLADSVEDALDQKNLPKTYSLPTLFFESRKNLPDEDKSIRHIQLEFTIQNYERN